MKDEPSADDSILSSIAAVREAWLDAVRARDAERLTELVTEDVVVVHDNGRCARGRDELKADFLKAFDAFSIEQKVSLTESYGTSQCSKDGHVLLCRSVAKRCKDIAREVKTCFGSGHYVEGVLGCTVNPVERRSYRWL